MKHLEAQSNSESTFRVLHQVHAFFISQVKVDTSRHRICFRWHYVLISSFAFLITFHSSKFFLLASPAETAHAAIIAQCRSREQFQSGGTPQGHLVQPAAPARTKCSIRSGSGGLFFFLDKVWKSTVAETDSSQLLCLAFSCWNLSFFRSHRIFSHWNLCLWSSVFTLQRGPDPISSVTTP